MILGAGGFLGRAVLMAGPVSMPVAAVSRKPALQSARGQGPVVWHAADLLVAGSLDPLLGPGDIVCNLAYDSTAAAADNIKLIDNVIAACLRARAARLIHCSTAMVVGVVRQRQVLESTACRPRSLYERTKWAIEQRVLDSVAKGLDAAILRPTAIVGPGGRNLLKLADSVRNGSPFVNYLRASVSGRRTMNLVPVQNVAQAVLHLASLPGPLAGNVFCVSADDDPANNFRCVETTLTQALGLKPRTFPLLPVPSALLSILLRLRGRSGAEALRQYDQHKLLATGFAPTTSVLSAVRELGAALRSH